MGVLRSAWCVVVTLLAAFVFVAFLATVCGCEGDDSQWSERVLLSENALVGSWVKTYETRSEVSRMTFDDDHVFNFLPSSYDPNVSGEWHVNGNYLLLEFDFDDVHFVTEYTAVVYDDALFLENVVVQTDRVSELVGTWEFFNSHTTSNNSEYHDVESSSNQEHVLLTINDDETFEVIRSVSFTSIDGITSESQTTTDTLQGTATNSNGSLYLRYTTLNGEDIPLEYQRDTFIGFLLDGFVVMEANSYVDPYDNAMRREE